MRMKLTDRLKVEHGVFLRQLSFLEELCAAGAPSFALRAVVATITAAEEQHALIEERTLYPALARILGTDAPLLAAAAAEHRQVAALARRMSEPGFAIADVTAFAAALRKHLEREIHDVFRIAEELLSDDRLASLCNWDEEHVFEEAGQRGRWLDSLGPSRG